MTEKEKAKAYDEAIERVKKLYSNGIAEEIFPELKESKDKKIREAILNGLIDCRDAPDLGWSNFGGINIDDCISWLENQGKKYTDKIEPRFKVGDWVIFITSKNVYQVEKKENYEYTLRHIFGGSLCLPFSSEELIREWTIQDAKDGDVICYKDEISLYKHNIKNYTKQETTFGGFIYYCCYDGKRFITDSFYTLTEQDKTDIHPATQEQSDLLFQKIQETGYRWIDETKTLEKLGESKFHKGDWVVDKFSDSWHIDSLDKKNYQVSNGEGDYNYFPISKQDEMHLWTIKDVKDGDVLSFYSEYKSNKMVQIGIIEKYVGKLGGCSNTFKIYIGINWDNILQIGKYMGCSNIHPATKEQRDALMKEINNIGYEWDTENKELRRNYLYLED